MNRTSLALLLALWIQPTLSSPLISSEGPRGELELQLEPDEVTVTLGEPILLDLALRNRSARTMSLDLGGEAKSNLYVTVRSPHRAAVPGHLEDEPGEVSFGGEVELPPGGSYATTLILSSWFDFCEPGIYEVTVALPVGPANPPMVIRAQDQARVTVRPRDPEVLKKVCTELAAETIDTRTPRARLTGRALGQVWDSVCLSALQRVLLGSGFAKADAVTGIARVGTPEAIQVLVDTWEKLDRGMRSRALWEFYRRGGDEALRAAIREAGLEVVGEEVQFEP